MLTPMRSFTLPTGFWLSSLATTSATQPPVTLLSLTSGVCPISSVTSFAIFMHSLPYSITPNEMAEASGGRTHRRQGNLPPAGFEDRDDHRTACASRRAVVHQGEFRNNLRSV